MKDPYDNEIELKLNITVREAKGLAQFMEHIQYCIYADGDTKHRKLFTEPLAIKILDQIEEAIKKCV